MSDATPIDLSNQFLIAMPAMADPNFAGAVVYVCEHTPDGALGLVINRPTDLNLGALFERIDLALDTVALRESPVFFGGPVHTDRGLVLHDPIGQYAASLEVGGGLALTTSRDVLQAVAHGNGPARMFVTLGYAGWEAGQLEAELADNAWLTVMADPTVIFDVPPADRFAAALRLLGVDPIMLADHAGHA